MAVLLFLLLFSVAVVIAVAGWEGFDGDGAGWRAVVVVVMVGGGGFAREAGGTVWLELFLFLTAVS